MTAIPGKAGGVLMMMEVVLMLMAGCLVLVRAQSFCDGSGCCQPSNNGPGPLNMTPGSGFDAKEEGEKTFIYHCVKYFTSLRWYRLVNDDLIPFPWGQGGRVRYLAHRNDNQTVLIPHVRLQDAGTYVYVASNGTHQANGSFQLQVDCKDTGPSFATSEPSTLPVELGRATTLSCALNPPHCPFPVGPDTLFWIWRNDTTSRPKLLSNDTLDDVDIVCDSGGHYGKNCTVVIRRVQPPLYHGQFVCRLAGGDGSVNQTVRLVPVVTTEKCGQGCVIGITAAAAGLLMIIVLGLFTRWRYGHRLAFRYRSPPERGNVEHDAVILHGEDHQDLVRNILRPELQRLNYNTMEETTPDRLDLMENLQGVSNSHSVLLTYSTRELEQDGQVDLLAKYVFRFRSRDAVLFIRCPDDDFLSDVRGGNSTEGEREEEDMAREALNRPRKNVWKEEQLRDFRILDLPEGLGRGRSDNLSFTERRDVEKFWYQVRNYLPKVEATRRYPSQTSDRKASRNTSTTESLRPLMGSCSTDRHTSLTGPSSQSRRLTDLEATLEEEENRKGIPSHGSVHPGREGSPRSQTEASVHGHSSSEEEVFRDDEPRDRAPANQNPQFGITSPIQESQPQSSSDRGHTTITMADPQVNGNDRSLAINTNSSINNNTNNNYNSSPPEYAQPSAHGSSSNGRFADMVEPRPGLGKDSRSSQDDGIPSSPEGEPSDYSKAMLQSQESGYHSPVTTQPICS